MAGTHHFAALDDIEPALVSGHDDFEFLSAAAFVSMDAAPEPTAILRLRT